MATSIKVVLQDDVESLGGSGDVVKVRPGYARNFLIPRGLAVPATVASLARVGDLKRLAAQKAERALEEAKALAIKLEAASIKLERAVGAENKMYGSVTSKDIEEAYAAQHSLNFERRKLVLPDPIKTLGLTEVPLKLHADVVVQLRVEVVKQG
ncbi:MAG TPA: 50S ribosomal protein L9 [Polyangiaceae bacterium]|nr:50S ribosomal protein L9 [Polyangiaceae bacterium]